MKLQGCRDAMGLREATCLVVTSGLMWGLGLGAASGGSLEHSPWCSWQRKAALSSVWISSKMLW